MKRPATRVKRGYEPDPQGSRSAPFEVDRDSQMHLRRALMGAAALAALGTAGGARAQTADAVGDIVVTGSLIGGAHRIAPVEIVSRRTLDAAGVTDASRILPLVTANSGSEYQVDQLNQPQSSGTAQFN